ncbi:MAG TPA: hypothetical protein VIE43_15500 [Thermoanaerobaculia bacterium]|jgi:hypothetical protein|nr:hypothetical protein [Thermoanaerobaculia bacterium]
MALKDNKRADEESDPTIEDEEVDPTIVAGPGNFRSRSTPC